MPVTPKTWNASRPIATTPRLYHQAGEQRGHRARARRCARRPASRGTGRARPWSRSRRPAGPSAIASGVVTCRASASCSWPKLSAPVAAYSSPAPMKTAKLASVVSARILNAASSAIGRSRKNAGQPVAGQRGDLEPDEQVEQVGGQRRPDQRGEQQLEQAGVPAQLARPEAAQLGQRVQQQHRADDRRGQSEHQAERVRGERDAQHLAVHRGPVAQVMGDGPGRRTRWAPRSSRTTADPASATSPRR